ncbi:MAG: hypothetical protein QM749_11530 [Aquabacterium sp.]
MGSSTIRALHALVALAHIDMGDAALTLADHLDEQSQAARKVEHGEAQINQMGMVYERLVKPGAPVYAAALGVLARQSMAGKAVLQEARSVHEQARQRVDEQRRVVHEHQGRHEGLSKILKEARAAHAAEVEKKAASEREDLILVRRHLLEQGA